MILNNMKKMVKIRVSRSVDKEREGNSYGQPTYSRKGLEVDVFVHKSLEGDPDLVKLIKTAIKEIQ